jgi:formylglycine-generating enzyme required for sulfatase activity
VSDREKRPDKVNYDLTTPNAFPQGGEQQRRPAAPDDRTTINQPARAPEARPPAPDRYDLTSVHNVAVPFDEDEDASAAHTQRTPAQTPAAHAAVRTAAPARGRVPGWVWGALGLSALLLVSCAGLLLAYFLLSAPAAFTLRVLDAPGSKVYVDDIPSGVPQRDGSIMVQGLRAGEPRVVSVRQEGFAEWKTTVTGKAGEVLDLRANMTPVAAPRPSLPAEIDYRGTMVLVAAGEFVMGADDGDPNEAPAHNVSLPDYYIDKFEVTNEQYDKFCKETGRPAPVDPEALPNYFRENPRKPVMGVSYEDAAAYAGWAGKRLPTEQEWEKAASWDPSSRKKLKWPWGNTEEQGRANIGTEGPAEVGQHAGGASTYGVHDMAGNVVEWVDAVYAPYPGSAYQDKDYGKRLRVFRGGSFPWKLSQARTTYRYAKEGATKATASQPSVIGFRCAISADDPRLKSHLRQGGTR